MRRGAADGADYMTVTARMDVRLYGSMNVKAEDKETLNVTANLLEQEIIAKRRIPREVGELDVDVTLHEVTDHGN